MITAEINQVGREMRKDMYNPFRKNVVNIDIRGTKKIQVYYRLHKELRRVINAPTQRRHLKHRCYSKESEVDVAFVIKVMNFSFQNQLDKFILLEGDGDLRNMVTFITEMFYRKVDISGYKGGIAKSLIERAKPAYDLNLDYILGSIS